MHKLMKNLRNLKVKEKFFNRLNSLHIKIFKLHGPRNTHVRKSNKMSRIPCPKEWAVRTSAHETSKNMSFLWVVIMIS